MNAYPKYRRTLRALRTECPVDWPVRVRLYHRSTAKDHRGHRLAAHVDWSRDGESVNVSLWTRYGRRKVRDEELVETLMHEWAHAMTMASETPHSPEWGVAFARVYSAVVED